MSKKKPSKPRQLVTLGMVLTRKGGPMRDRRDKRAGNKKRQQELFD